MLESLLNDIYSINPLLGNFVKLSFISLVVMIAIIPLSFFISLLNGAMNDSFLKVDHYFSSVLTKLVNNIHEIIKRFKDFFNNLIKNNQIVTEEELITQKIDTNSISKNLDQISAELTVIPGMVTSKNRKGEEGINHYKEELDRLSKIKLSKLKLDVPEIKLDITKEKKAKTAFVIFVALFPILLILILFNTSLLIKVFEALDIQGGNIFRTDLFGLLPKKFSVTVSTIISFGFSLVETAIGIFLAIITFNKDEYFVGKSETEFNEKFKPFLWGGFFTLMLIEAIAYFVLGFYQIRNDFGMDSFQELFESEMLTFVHYLRLCILPAVGVVVVGGLFGLGHFVTMKFLTYRLPLESKRIKKDLDKEREKVNKINEDLVSISSNVNNLADSIKNIQIQKIASEPISKTLSNLSKKIKQIFDDTNKEISRVKKNVKDFVGGKVEKKLSLEGVKMHVYSNMKNILIFIVGCIALYYTFPNELFIPGIKEIDSNIIWIITLLYPFFLAAFGNQLSTRKRFTIGEDEKEQIHDPNTTLIKTIGYAGIVVMIVSLFLLHFKYSNSNFIGLTLAISSCFGFLYVGYNLVHTMPSITLVVRGIYSLTLIFFNAVAVSTVYIIGRLFSVVKSLLEIGSYPSRKIMKFVGGK